MAVPYSEAISILQRVALDKSSRLMENVEPVPIVSAVGRICSRSYFSSMPTPPFDTSAMDGYAVNSGCTLEASPSNPIKFRVCGTMAAGDAPLKDCGSSPDDSPSCVEIMTGAQFPAPFKEMHFDACVKVEETTIVEGPVSEAVYIQIIKSAQPGQNRRLAGSDFLQQSLIASSGVTLRPHHVMAFAALGIREVLVFRKLRVGIVSTGSELLSHHDPRPHSESQIRDSNGPYIESVLSELGTEVTNFGIFKDDKKLFERDISRILVENPLDLLITTGAVSMGKFDFIGAAVKEMEAKIHFHRVEIRPGHPVLFATLPQQSHIGRIEPGKNSLPDSSLNNQVGKTPSDIALFGLPGNPLASAVCLRFLVIPYLKALHSLSPLDTPELATLRPPSQPLPDIFTSITPFPVALKKPAHLQIFWHGRRSHETKEVVVSHEQGSYKIRPLLEANCWVGIPAGKEGVEYGDTVETFEMYPYSLGL